ncbi:hypothetical protein D3C80_842760 [compost metagenome]
MLSSLASKAPAGAGLPAIEDPAALLLDREDAIAGDAEPLWGLVVRHSDCQR